MCLTTKNTFLLSQSFKRLKGLLSFGGQAQSVSFRFAHLTDLHLSPSVSGKLEIWDTDKWNAFNLKMESDESVEEALRAIDLNI